MVNQAGATSPLPAPNAGWAGEITLDVQSVRGLCHGCKILLVEGDNAQFQSLATAEDTAAAYPWTVGSTTVQVAAISNSYGGREDAGLSTYATHYRHPGIAVTASTGDDGWYGWDTANAGVVPDGAPSWPASLATVVAVSGTSLYLNPDGSRSAEQVWNGNGPDDVDGTNPPRGAAGGGCSTLADAKAWQSAVRGYAALGCAAGKRSVTDIAAVADPYTGYDIYQSYDVTPGWSTYGGTSLASPVVAALWGLAGGTGGVSYPALSLYGHFTSAPTSLYDVTKGGTGLCDTTPMGCPNPNTLGWGPLDCAFPWSGHSTVTGVYQCYARRGYDGVSGVGTPNGTTPFKAMNPTAHITKPSKPTHGHAATFKGSRSTDPFPGGTLTSYVWHWGDGHKKTSTTATVTHTYTKKGTYTVTLSVTDRYFRVSAARTTTVTVK